MAEVFRKKPAYAVELLNDILKDGAQDELLIALRQMALAYGGIAKIAEATQLNGSHLYRALSAGGNPEVRSLLAILKAMGLCLAVRPEPAKAEEGGKAPPLRARRRVVVA